MVTKIFCYYSSFCSSRIKIAGLWIRIHCGSGFSCFCSIRIRGQLLFLMRIRIQLIKICNKLPYEEYSGVEKKTMELMQIYLQFRQIFLLLFVFSQIFFSNFFSLKSFSSGSGCAYWMRIRILEGKWMRIHPFICCIFQKSKHKLIR